MQKPAAMACSAPNPPGSTAKACSLTKAAPPTCCSSPCAKAKPSSPPPPATATWPSAPACSHWESQSTTTAASPTGQRYIHHEARGSRVLLFVREQRKQDGRPGAPTEPFLCLGFARYEGHEGERPMAIRWRLEREIPAAWLPVMALAV